MSYKEIIEKIKELGQKGQLTNAEKNPNANTIASNNGKNSGRRGPGCRNI